MKLIVLPSNKEQIIKLIKKVDGYIISLKDLSVNGATSFEMDELCQIIEMLKEQNKDVFVSLNKNMHNSDLDNLKKVMGKIDEYNITGILFYDVAVVNIKNELNLKTDLVWSQEHLATNYVTSNYWYEFGAKYTYLSSELTIDEIKDIKVNAKGKLMLNFFGHLPMFVSKRHLVKSYTDTFNLNSESKINYIQKEGLTYPLIEDKNGTIAYSHYILNGINEMLELDIDYAVLNSFGINETEFDLVIGKFRTVDTNNSVEYMNEIDSMFETDRGFLYKETIYKVKKNGN